MEAGTLRCPGCGAPNRPEAHRCEHCKAPLATVACPSCFGMGFRGTRHCPHCGVRADRAEAVDERALACPHCRAELGVVRVGETSLRECSACAGLWMDRVQFEALAADRDRQAAVLALPGPPGNAAAPGAAEPVRYRSCPHCGTLMNRQNFQRISG